MPKKKTTTLRWRDGRGKTQVRTINYVLDVRDYVGMPGFAMLVVAANRDVAATDVLRFLEYEGVGRSQTWVRRRRWMFQEEGTDNGFGNKVNADGRDGQAVQIMNANPTVSVRMLAAILKGRGIVRSREWVRIHRLD